MTANDRDAVEITEILITYGVSVNEYNYKGLSPLQLAVSSSNLSLVSFLIEKGADVNTADICEKTPLFEAISKQNVKIVDKLISSGADISAKNRGYLYPEWTALHLACWVQSKQITNILLRNGADIRKKTTNGETPLFKLTKWSDKDYVKCPRSMIREFSKLIFENEPICINDMILLNDSSDDRKLLDMCTSELRQMSSTKFYGLHSYYSVLKMSKNIKKLANLTRNEEFLQRFELDLHRFRFFQDDLRFILEKAIQLRDKIDIVYSKLYSVFKDSFPDIVIRKLVENVTVKDLPLKSLLIHNHVTLMVI